MISTEHSSFKKKILLFVCFGWYFNTLIWRSLFTSNPLNRNTRENPVMNGMGYFNVMNVKSGLSLNSLRVFGYFFRKIYSHGNSWTYLLFVRKQGSSIKKVSLQKFHSGFLTSSGDTIYILYINIISQYI